MHWIVIIVVWTFAFYGVFEFIKEILYLSVCTKFNAEGLYVIIAAKNQENTIEALIRNMMFKMIYGKEENIKNLILVDLNSSDQTKDILEKLQSDYDCIKVMNWKDCKELVENIKEVR